MSRYIILILFVSLPIFAQNNSVTDNRLAANYYRSQEYNKAADLYLKLYQSSGSKVYFTYYTRRLIALKEYKTAEKVIKREIKRNPKQTTYLVKLGNLYKIQNKPELSEKYYTQAIEKQRVTRNGTIQLANEFLNMREYDYAEKVYLIMRKKMGSYKFRFELASVYAFTRNFQEMIDEYMQALSENPASLNTVKARLQYYVKADTDNFSELLLQATLRKVQARTNPDATNAFTEMLLWLYIQQKNYSMAFIQAKALDKRVPENDGYNLLKLGKLAKENKAYATAQKCFRHVLSDYGMGSYGTEAKFEYLSTMYHKTIDGLTLPNEIPEIEAQYLGTIAEFGLSVTTIELTRELAYLQAYKLNKPQSAFNLLSEASEIANLPKELRANCKLDLADVMIYKGDIWDAILLYAAIEHENKENPKGFEAKFRKAKAAWYSGNFDWAKSQLDVIKESTSKLIANDALELSVVIDENTLGDSVETALKQYARADFFIARHMNTEAHLTLDSVITQHPDHMLKDEAYFLKAKLFLSENKIDTAVVYLEKIANSFSYDILADNALFYLAEIYRNKLNKPDMAMEYYLKIMTNHKDSWYVSRAREHFRLLRGDLQ